MDAEKPSDANVPEPSDKPFAMRMEVFFVRRWGRVILVVLSVVLVDVMLVDPEASSELREGAVRALQAISLLFAVTTAISLALFSNYVAGIGDAYWAKVSEIRDLLEKIYDKFAAASDSNLRSVIHEGVYPLLCLGRNQWDNVEAYKDWQDPIKENLVNLRAQDEELLPRYFLRLEDEMGALGLLYIRRVFAHIHVLTITGAFLLVIVAMCCLGFASMAPRGSSMDFIVVNACTAVMVFAVLEMLLLVSFVRQQGRDEAALDHDEDSVPPSLRQIDPTKEHGPG